MVRKLEKIDKELGYCEVKLEKARRLKKQQDFLSAELEAVGRFLKLYESSDLKLHELPFAAISQQIAVERSRSEKPGPAFERAREDFVSAGVFQLVREDQETLVRERNEIRTKLANYSGFSAKRNVLESEREETLTSLGSSQAGRVQRLGDEFKAVEADWNSLTEDALNLDEAIFYLSRNVDYIKSARSFLVAAKGSFDVENWLDSGFVTDLFRHSNIARAKEMFDGACRNQKLARNELCCMVHLHVELEGFEPMLSQFLSALFEDIFLEGRLVRSLSVIETAFEKSETYLKRVRDQREVLHSKLDATEKVRNQLFLKLGGERRGRVSTG